MLLFLLCIIGGIGFAQDISGAWNGILKVQGTQLRLTFNVVKTNEGISATLDSPDQGAYGIPVKFASIDQTAVKFGLPEAYIEYTGKLESEDKITGTFTQAGQSYPLDLTRSIPEKEKLNRPQEPVKPYPYYSEDIKFENKTDTVWLAGTLTLPKKEGKFPAVILISGSGPQNRDEEVMGHKPFLVISDHLTRNGFAVLRFDDRGTGESTGSFSKATTFDFTKDVKAALNFLLTRTDIEHENIGLIGHSEGGIIAPMVAADSKEVNFIVLMAGTGIRGDKLLLMQQELIGKVSGVEQSEIDKMITLNKQAFDIVNETTNQDTLEVRLKQFIKTSLNEIPTEDMPEGMSEDDFIHTLVDQITSPWMQYFIRLDPSIALQKVDVPVLAINGANDIQVPSKINLDAIEKAIRKGGNSEITVIEMPGLNHLFQESATGDINEYAKIEQTISTEVLEQITIWLKNQVSIKSPIE